MGRSPLNCGAFDGTATCRPELPFPPPCLARSDFQRSTSCFTSSRSALSSPISCSSCLNSAPISALSASSSRGAPWPASRASSAPYRSRHEEAGALGIDDGAAGDRSHAAAAQRESDPLSRREELLDVEDDDQTLALAPPHDALQVLSGKSAKERRGRRDAAVFD